MADGPCLYHVAMVAWLQCPHDMPRLQCSRCPFAACQPDFAPQQRRIVQSREVPIRSEACLSGGLTPKSAGLGGQPARKAGVQREMMQAS